MKSPPAAQGALLSRPRDFRLGLGRPTKGRESMAPGRSNPRRKLLGRRTAWEENCAGIGDNRSQVANANGRQRGAMTIPSVLFLNYRRESGGGDCQSQGGRAWRELAMCGWSLSSKSGGRLGSSHGSRKRPAMLALSRYLNVEFAGAVCVVDVKRPTSAVGGVGSGIIYPRIIMRVRLPLLACLFFLRAVP
jgi:hypothetical protein